MKKYLLLSALLCTSLFALADNDDNTYRFSDIALEVSSWHRNVVSSSDDNAKKSRTVAFADLNYSITGIFSRGTLKQGTIARFYDTSSSTPKLL